MYNSTFDRRLEPYLSVKFKLEVIDPFVKFDLNFMTWTNLWWVILAVIIVGSLATILYFLISLIKGIDFDEKSIDLDYD